VKSWNSNFDCYTGWSSHDYMEVWEPTTAEQSMVTYTQRVGTDNSADASSSVNSLVFNKKSSSSNLRILYYDNLRVYGHAKWCRWEVKVDGRSCPAPLAGSVYTHGTDNDHYPGTILGECLGANAGRRSINIAITRSSGADCHTGWTPGLRVMHALIEVQESKPMNCPLESGFCVTSRGGDQNSGVIKLTSGDVVTSSQRASCLQRCMNYGLVYGKVVTGCEGIYSQSNRGCYVHTAEVSHGNRVSRHYCWIFSKCKYT